MRRPAWRWLSGLLLLAVLGWSGGVQAAALQFCDRGRAATAAHKDLLLRFAAVVRDELAEAGQGPALVSRSGLDLSHFDMRYSHAGIVRHQPETQGWTVRELYFACDEGRPRIFDEGLAGFVMGTDDPELGYVSLVFLPAPVEGWLAEASQDNALALELLAARYSANAYPFDLAYQNCNQWVMEVLAATLGRLQGSEPPLRPRAQQWLQHQGYQPSVFQFEFAPVMWFGLLIPWIHASDHPREALAQLRFQVSMPASMEAFVHALLPTARRVEICHRGGRVVVHRGWDPVADGCLPGASDRVLDLR